MSKAIFCHDVGSNEYWLIKHTKEPLNQKVFGMDSPGVGGIILCVGKCIKVNEVYELEYNNVSVVRQPGSDKFIHQK